VVCALFAAYMLHMCLTNSERTDAGTKKLMVDTGNVDATGMAIREVHIPILGGVDADTPMAAAIHRTSGHSAILGCGK
jgi:hypothetical protein